MNALFVPLVRATVQRKSVHAILRPQRVPLVAPSTALHARFVASNVSGKPGSQSLEHAATNVKEELGNSASDLAKVIASADVNQDATMAAKSGADSFFGITNRILHQVPRPILSLGLAGAIPYVGTSATTLYLAYEAGQAASGISIRMDPGVALTVFDQALNIQVTYGAILLSFLGALHWGMEMAGYGGHQGYKRLALGTAPMLIAWPTLGMQPMVALSVQWLAFTALWYADSKATTAGWTPKWYSQYRFYLSILIGSCIVASLAGTSYWGPVAGHGFVTHDLEYLREERKKHVPEKHSAISGTIEVVPADESDEHYTKIHKRKAEDEGESEK